MTDRTVNRWRRYGKDRLYVNLPDGSRVGWHDVQTGTTTLELEGLRDAFVHALEAHGVTVTATPLETKEVTQRATPAEEAAEIDMAPAEAPGPFAVTIDWRDVSTHEAGKAAQLQAREKRRDTPVRTLVARLLGVHTDERAWRVGATGERWVGARLDRLPEPWRVLHAIPVGDRGADIDHLVIGPGGVFTVNTKHHPQANVWVGGDTFLVNGHRRPYVRKARDESRRAGRLLSTAVGFDVEVSGVIAVAGARRCLIVKAQPDDVRVVAPGALARSLPRLPEVLTADAVETIFRAARRSDTWR